jgi:hypothetical protein
MINKKITNTNNTPEMEIILFDAFFENTSQKKPCHPKITKVPKDAKNKISKNNLILRTYVAFLLLKFTSM